MALPIAGILQPFTAFLNDSDPAGPESSAPTDGPSHSDSESDSPWGTQSESQSHRHSPIHRPQPGTVLGRAPELACYPPRFPVRYIEPSHPWRIALVERGECDFASKVRAAQERGAAGVIVGDMKVREGETDEEGRTREGLITMFSPGEWDILVNGFTAGSLVAARRVMWTHRHSFGRAGLTVRGHGCDLHSVGVCFTSKLSSFARYAGQWHDVR